MMKDTIPSLTCSNCSHQNPIEAKFCENCGKKLARACPACGTTNSEEAKFCLNCGEALQPSTPARRETRLSELQQAAPEGLQERIRASSSEIEGERKPVTILFTDIVGSTAIAEKLDPEIWKEVVASAHRRVGEAIYRYEGTIAQLLGDGMLAFFGAPITHEDDPLRAVRAALDIQESIKDYAHELEDLIEDFQMRVGINTGEVVIGNIGTDLHMEYLALGDAVNIAARLQSTAEPGKVLLSGSTARLLGDAFELKSLGEVPVKGKEDTVETYEIVGSKALPGRRVGLLEFRTPFVDREMELEALRSSLLKLCEGQGQIVSLVGEPGIGKTRLLEEVREFLCEKEEDFKAVSTPPSSLRWLEGRALSYGGSLSYWTITQLLLVDLGLSDGASQVEIKVALRHRMEELFDEKQVGEVMPYISKLLGITQEGEAKEHIEALDGERLKGETHRALRDYFTAVAKKDPTVLVLEDMHWIDPSSLEVLEGLLPLTDHVPFMILMLMRIERDHGSWELLHKAETDFHHRFTDIHLRRLSEVDSKTLVKHLLGSEELLEEILKPILTRAEGNPFYLEELVRHMIEEGMITQDDRGWHPTEAISEIGIPDTLQGVLLARIDRLEEDVRSTLQMASVIGKSFLYRILEAISEAERELDAHLSQLQRLDLVREKTRIPELEYIFKQTLTQEAAYNSLLHERRKEFHYKVGEALEKLFPDRIDDFLGLLAHHYEAANETSKATDYLVCAGDEARLASAHKEAVDFYQRALRFLSELEDYAMSASTLMKLGLAHNNAYEFELSREAYDESFKFRILANKKARSLALEGVMQSLRINWEEPRSLDLAFYTGVPGIVIHDHLFSGLVKITSDYNIIPDVARSWDISGNGQNYVFHLRDDCKWSDGIPITAHDFEYSWKRVISDPNCIWSSSSVYPLAGVDSYLKDEASDLNDIGVQAIDDFTLKVDLEEPRSDFIYRVASPLYNPVPNHVVKKYGKDWTDIELLVTNGLFKLHSWVKDQSMRLDRDPKNIADYHGNVMTIELDFSIDPQSTLREYEADKLDILRLYNFPFDERDQLIQRHASEYFSKPDVTTTFLAFNTNQPPFDDQRVRQSLALTINHDFLANVVFRGSHIPAFGGLIPPGLPGHSTKAGINCNLDLARELLSEAGFPEGTGFPNILGLVSGDNYEFRKITNYLSEIWKEVLGIEINWNHLPLTGEIWSREDKSLLYVMARMPLVLDPSALLDSPTFLLEGYWQNINFDRIIQKCRHERDPGKRIALFKEADNILLEDVVIVPLLYGNRQNLIKPWVKNYNPIGLYNMLENVIIEPH